MIRDRIKELRRVRASELIPDERNWRQHPEYQRKALEGVLAEIGFSDALLVRETSEGLVLIDGHLRAETAPDAEVPVLILDVDEHEAQKLLLTLDPLASMAVPDMDKLMEGLQVVSFDNEGVNAMMEALTNGSYRTLEPMPLFEPVGVDEQGKLDEKALTRCPECGHEF